MEPLFVGVMIVVLLALAVLAVLGHRAFRAVRTELQAFRPYVANALELASEVRTELQAFRPYVANTLGLAKGEAEVGLERVVPDSANYDYGPVLANSQRVVLLLNDGRTWLSVHRDKLRKRFADPEKETTVFLIHPDSSMISVLARKASVESSVVQGRVRESVELMREVSTPTTKLEILGHDLFNPFSVVLADDVAVVVQYFVSRGGRTVPAFVYANAGEGSYHQMLAEDFEALRKDARDIGKRPATLSVVRSVPSAGSTTTDTDHTSGLQVGNRTH